MQMTKLPKLKTVSEVIMLVGGVDNLCQYTKASPNTIYNWKASNQFPANTYKAIWGLVKMYGRAIDESLFPMMVLADVPRIRGKGGRFVSKKPSDLDKMLEAIKNFSPEPIEVWRDAEGNVVSPEMQVMLTHDALTQHAFG